jgi:hypothetical protein
MAVIAEFIFLFIAFPFLLGFVERLKDEARQRMLSIAELARCFAKSAKAACAVSISTLYLLQYADIPLEVVCANGK